MTASGANLKHVWMAMRLRCLVEETQKMIRNELGYMPKSPSHAGVHAEDSTEFPAGAH